MDQQDISKVIRELRADLNLTQEQFASKIGVTVSTIHRWENDKGKPSRLALRQLEKLQKKAKRKKPSK